MVMQEAGFTRAAQLRDVAGSGIGQDASATLRAETVLFDRLASSIIDSLQISRNGTVQLKIPAGVSNLQVLEALNDHFKQLNPEGARSGVALLQLSSVLRATGAVGVSTEERSLEILPVISATSGQSREQQSYYLERRGMKFAELGDLAVVALAYACKEGGKDLFGGMLVRTSTPGCTLYTNSRYGVMINGNYQKHQVDESASSPIVAASGERIKNDQQAGLNGNREVA